MKVIDAGHEYQLTHVGEQIDWVKSHETITFIKRSGKLNTHDVEYNGTNVQECLRVLIDRTLYLDEQLTCEESKDALYYLRQTLFIFEARAYRRKLQKQNRQDGLHDKPAERYKDIPFSEYEIENLPVGSDGHILL